MFIVVELRGMENNPVQAIYNTRVRVKI